MLRVVTVVMLAAIGGGAAALASRDSGPDSAGGGGETRAATRVKPVGCATAIRDGIGPAGQYDLVVGPVMLRDALRHGRRDRSEFRPSRERDGSAKMGVVVQPGTELVLSIHKKQRRLASLAYTEDTRAAKRVEDGYAALRFRSCSDDRPTGWPGSVIVSEPRCVRLAFAIVGTSGTPKRKIELGRDTC